jgi:N-acetylglucosaminyl-diphospho-decaprenol L-rhamnosyltransferase
VSGSVSAPTGESELRAAAAAAIPIQREIELSIVAVVWNNLDVVRGMVESVFAQVDREKTEVIFVDNGSTDGTIEYLRGCGDVTVIENGVNAGYPTAMNRGAQIARGTYVLLVNPDLVFRPGSLAAMVRALERDPGLGGVSPVIEVPPEPATVYPLLAGDPGLWYGFAHFSGLMQRFRGNRRVNFHMDYAPEKNDGVIPWIHGCCGMYRRAALAPQGGGFDERFFIYFEDADLGRSLRKAGWRLAIARDARVLHLEDQTCKSWHKYHRKHSSLAYRIVAWWTIAAALGLQLAVQLAKLPLGRATYCGVIREYWRHHLRAPFADFEGERARELEETKAKFRPWPSKQVTAGVGARSAAEQDALPPEMASLETA